MMNNLRKIRLSKGLTQEELANLLSVNRTTVTLWEIGINKPRADMLVKIAKVLNCTIDGLLCSKT